MDQTEKLPIRYSLTLLKTTINWLRDLLRSPKSREWLLEEIRPKCLVSESEHFVSPESSVHNPKDCDLSGMRIHTENRHPESR